MRATRVVAATPTATNGAAYPSGLIPPSRRGRSQRAIGDVIVDLGFACREAVDEAVATAREQGKMTGQVLIESGVMRQDQLARALAERFGLDYIDLSVFPIDMGAAHLVNVPVAKRYQAVPVGFMPHRTVLLAMADPTNLLTLDEMAMIMGMKVRPAAAAPDDIAALIGRLSQLDAAVAEVEEIEPEPELTIVESLAADAPLIKLVHSVIAEAVQHGASDIHCKPGSDDMHVLFRVDGVLTSAATVARNMAPGVVSRIKIMAGLDIAERRVPQDGRLAVTVDGRRIDVRVVTLPLVKGEGVVMRILDAGAVVRDLQSLGMHVHDRERLEAAVGKSQGAILVTGPTGSGKSTTVYSALAILNDGQRSILTIEDPVESQIAGIDQMQISPKAGVTFATGLRSMLRADPDVIMVGEIRDPETAEISVQAALTGHLVLSTLHTRDAASAVTRLIDMRVEPFMIAAAIDCVVAQRLARTLCTHCKRPTKLPRRALVEHGLEGGTLFDAAGCIRCGGAGYLGRVGLYEVMPITEEIRNLVLERRGVDEIQATAVAQSMRTMREDGIDKVKQGLTTLAEIARVSCSL
jgi:type IV pilus assembly protein PilB